MKTILSAIIITVATAGAAGATTTPAAASGWQLTKCNAEMTPAFSSNQRCFTRTRRVCRPMHTPNGVNNVCGVVRQRVCINVPKRHPNAPRLGRSFDDERNKFTNR